MAIPEAQLDTWSHQGSITQSSNTYSRIKNVLEASDTPYSSKSYKVFLQGSYGNDTNIYAESDVDVVIVLNDVFLSDLTNLDASQKSAYETSFKDATYSHQDFKRDVVSVLSKAFGDDVKVGDKAIAIAPNAGRRKADVIAAIQFRRYHKFNGLLDQTYDEGICFFNSAGERIANYPKQHSQNLTKKHQASNMWLKPMIRIMKNMRNKMIEKGSLKAGTAPSYYIEGLLYNVPSDKFGLSYAQSFVNAMTWIQSQSDKSKLVCANEQYYLLRDNASTCWPVVDGETFINAVVEFWNNY